MKKEVLKPMEAPIFEPTLEEFQNPVGYIKKICSLSKSSGLCIIRPPQNWSPTCVVEMNVDLHTTETQEVKGLKETWSRKLDFYKELISFHKNLGKSFFIPWVDGKSLDLFMLHKLVKENGGFETVCNLNNWSIILDEMNIPAAARKLVSDYYREIFSCFDISGQTVSKNTQSADSVQNIEKKMNATEYGEMADEFKMNYFWKPVDEVKKDVIEKEFWRIFDTGKMDDTRVTVHSLSDFHGSGFPTSDMKDFLLEDLECMKSDWNFCNLQGLSLLHCLNKNLPIKKSRCRMEMCFSSSPWQMMEYGSYSINYIHWGDSKTWYSVPEQSSKRFEEMVLGTDVSCRSPDLLNNLGCMMHPDALLEHDISVTKAVQHAGEFLVTFPRSYISNMSHGSNFSESINYFPEEWLPYGDVYRRLCKSEHRPCAFSFDELLCRQLKDLDSLSSSLLSQIHGIFSPLVENENVLRKKISDMGVEKSKREAFELIPDKSRMCKVCREICFLSAVTCTCSNNTLVCLNHADSLCQCPSSNYCLRYRYTTEELTQKLNHLNICVESYSGWIKRVNMALKATDQQKLDIKDLRTLKVEGKRKVYPEDDLFSCLNDVLQKAKELSELAQQLLNKSGSGSDKLTYEELVELRDQVDALPCKIPESELISLEQTKTCHQKLAPTFPWIDNCLKVTKLLKEKLTKAGNFRLEVNKLLSDSSTDTSTIATVVNFSQTMDVIVPEAALLKQFLEQRTWIDHVENSMAESEQVTVELIKKLIMEGRKITPHPVSEKTLINLEQLLSVCEKLEERSKQCLSSKANSSLFEVQSILEESASSKISVYLPNVIVLREAASLARSWIEGVDRVQSGEHSPYMSEVEKHLVKGRTIPLQMDKLCELESDVASAKTWLEKMAKTFLNKNSLFSLYEVLSPRIDINSTQGNRFKKKRTKDFDIGSVAMHGLLLEINVSENALPTPSAVAMGFKMAEYREINDMKILRSQNLNKVSLSDTKYCLCRQGKTSTMQQCELCKDLFHNSCIAIHKSQPSKKSNNGNSDTKFLCPMCSRSKRPKLEVILALLVNLQNLPVRIPEGEALQSLAERAMAWQDKARRLLGTDELSMALSRLSALNQQMAEHVAREKTEKIIRSELQKAASHGGASSNLGLLDYQNQGYNFMQVYSETDTPALHWEQEVVTQTMPFNEMVFEHAYSSASRQHQGTTRTKPQKLKLAEGTFAAVEQMMMEGDLLEVSMEEANHLFRILKACQPQLSEASQLLTGDTATKDPNFADGTEKMKKNKRKSLDVPKVDDSFEEIVETKKKQKLGKQNDNKGGKSNISKTDSKKKKNLKSSGQQSDKRKRKKSETSDYDDDTTTADDNDENCSAEKCLRPLGKEVDWVQCDSCELWFHLVCLGLAKHHIDEKKDFICIYCKERNERQSSNQAVAGCSTELHWSQMNNTRNSWN